MNKVLIIGGNKFAGKMFASRCAASDLAIDVTVLNRSGTGPLGVKIVKGDRHSMPSDFYDSFKYIIDFCAYKVQDFMPLQEYIRNDVGYTRFNKNYVFISSGAVYKETPQLMKSPYCTVENQIVKSPIGGSLAFGEYGKNKSDCEKYLHDFGHNLLYIVRPPFILGDPSRNIRVRGIIESILRGDPIPVDGDGTMPFSVVWVNDYVESLFSAIFESRVPYKIINITSNECYSSVSLIQEIGRLIPGSDPKVLFGSSTFDFPNESLLLLKDDQISVSEFRPIKEWIGEFLKNNFSEFIKK